MMFNRVSADGYFADANGGLGWATADPELDRAAGEGMPSNDTMIFGGPSSSAPAVAGCRCDKGA